MNSVLLRGALGQAVQRQLLPAVSAVVMRSFRTRGLGIPYRPFSTGCHQKSGSYCSKLTRFSSVNHTSERLFSSQPEQKSESLLMRKSCSLH